MAQRANSDEEAELRFLRLIRFVLSEGPPALHADFERYLRQENKSLVEYLAEHKETIEAKRKTETNKSGCLFPQQYELLYPPQGSPPEISGFDITLMGFLYQNVRCKENPNEAPTNNAWNRLPKDMSMTKGDDVVRVRTVRNELGHSGNFGKTQHEYETLWKTVEDALLRLYGSDAPAGLKKRFKRIKSEAFDERSIKMLRDTITEQAEQDAINMESIHTQLMDIKDEISKIAKQPRHHVVFNVFNNIQASMNEDNYDITGSCNLQSSVIKKESLQIHESIKETINNILQSATKTNGVLMLEHLNNRFDDITQGEHPQKERECFSYYAECSLLKFLKQYPTLFSLIKKKVHGKERILVSMADNSLTDPYAEQLKPKRKQNISTIRKKKPTKLLPAISNIPPSLNSAITPISQPPEPITPNSDEIRYIDDILKSPLSFNLDIVSIWNIPNRHSAYCLRIKTISDSNDFNIDLFKKNLESISNCFNYVPLYEIGIEGRNEIVLKILLSESFGEPCLVVVDEDDGKIKIKRNELYQYIHNQATCIEPTHPDFKDIFQWFSYKPVSIFDDIDDPDFGKEADNFFQKINNFKTGNAQGHYALILGRQDPSKKYLYEVLLRVPWLIIFDFDIDSTNQGVQSVAHEHRVNAVFTNTYKKFPISVKDNVTLWCLARGIKGEESVAPGTSKEWWSRVEDGIMKYIKDLARFCNSYTVLQLIVAWPDEAEEDSPHLQKLLLRICDKIDPFPEIILCMENKHQSDSLMDYLKRSEIESVISYKINLATICSGIKHIIPNKEFEETQYSLPTKKGDNSPGFVFNELESLKIHFNVLFLNNDFKQYSTQEIVTQEHNFHTGGSIEWGLRYSWRAGDEFDIQRELAQKMKKDLLHSLSIYYKTYKKNGLLKNQKILLNHIPGSGGSTLAKRLLWDMHELIPCAELKTPLSSLDSQDAGYLKQNIKLLQSRTQLPILILMDGASDLMMSRLSKELEMVGVTAIFICVHQKLSIRDSKGSRCENKYLLSETLSSSESESLYHKLRHLCTDKICRSNLMALHEEVKKGNQHHLIEYGLTAFTTEYRGLRPYVVSYLEPLDLEASQLKLLMFVSLSLYYGHTGIPIQWFCPLLYLPKNQKLNLEDMNLVKSFLKFESDSKNIILRHTLIAKEILEVSLNPESRLKDMESTPFLSENARQMLFPILKDFIEFLKRQNTSKTKDVVFKIFIRREVDGRFARVIHDIPSIERQEETLSLVVENFKDAETLLHLGRFYTYQKKDREKAQECFEEALQICNQRAVSDNEEETGLQDTFMRVYHSYGYHYLQQLEEITGGPSGTKHSSTNRDSNDEDLQFSFQFAKEARECYQKSRGYTSPWNMSTGSFLFEVRVMLNICDFVHRNWRKTEKHTNVIKVVSKGNFSNNSVKEFVIECIGEIDCLLNACSEYVDGKDSEYESLCDWNQTLFKSSYMDLQQLMQGSGGSNNSERRNTVAAIKLHHSNSREHLASLRAVDKIRHIERIVDLLGQNIDYVHRYSREFDWKYEKDLNEWLIAIRHPYYSKTISFNDVLAKVKLWYDNKKSLNSTFYYLILLTIQGLEGYTPSYLEAEIKHKELLEFRKKGYIRHLRYPREWLGNGKDFNCLVSGAPPNVQDNSHLLLFRQQSEKLKTMTGSICEPNDDDLSGYISVDFPKQDALGLRKIRAFYHPQINQLNDKINANKKVTFKLCFTFNHGYHARDVELIKKKINEDHECVYDD